MEGSPPAAGAGAAPEVRTAVDPSSQPSPPPPQPSPAIDGNGGDDGGEKPLSKNQLKKRRRWEKALAVKRRRKDQEREVRRVRAKAEGRDLNAERILQEQNTRDGTGWKRREEQWRQRTEKAKIDSSFRVCFDLSFEESMRDKEINSLSLQLRYTYAVNRKSPMPVYIDVCGLKKGGRTRAGLEKVEGFPDRWAERAFRCYEEALEEVYGKSTGGGECKSREDDADEKCKGGLTKQLDCSGKGDEACEGNEEKSVEECQVEKREEQDFTVVQERDDATKKTCDRQGTEEKDLSLSHKGDDVTALIDSGKETHPRLPPDHRFIYLTGDSPYTLTTLDNNTTYIIGGIVDRNRLKRAAIERAESVSATHPALKIQTARLPLDENFDFGGSTRVLTCNHVFEILQRYRERGYGDWKGAIASVLPDRKEVEEKGAVGKGGTEAGYDKKVSVDGGNKGDNADKGGG